jgi:uncharacterized protein YoxC
MVIPPFCGIKLVLVQKNGKCYNMIKELEDEPMDNSNLILEKLNSMEKALRSEIKILSDKQNQFTEKLNEFDVKLDMTWQAVQEVRDELANNSLKIKTIDNKVKAL